MDTGWYSTFRNYVLLPLQQIRRKNKDDLPEGSSLARYVSSSSSSLWTENGSVSDGSLFCVFVFCVVPKRERRMRGAWVGGDPVY